MKFLLLITAALISHQACAAMPLKELINQNVMDATAAYQQSLPPLQQQLNPARLWIHIRSNSQKQLAADILKKVNATPSWGKMAATPIQKVDEGPRASQLRYFRKQDEARAHELFEILHQDIPQLELQDLSRKYAAALWIKSGHYELWLSPEISHLQQQP